MLEQQIPGLLCEPQKDPRFRCLGLGYVFFGDGKSPSKHHHLGEYVFNFFFPSIEQADSSCLFVFFSQRFVIQLLVYKLVVWIPRICVCEKDWGCCWGYPDSIVDTTNLSYLEPQTTIYKWLFQLDDSKSLHRKWLSHQTTILKWLFGVPGRWWFQIFFIVTPIWGRFPI